MQILSERFKRSKTSRISLKHRKHIFSHHTSNANCTAPRKARSNSLPSSAFFFVWSFFESKKPVFRAPGEHSRDSANMRVLITRKGLGLNSSTNQRPSSKSVLMEVRFVTAVTRGDQRGFSPARHDRGFAAQFSPQTTEKKPLTPRVVLQMKFSEFYLCLHNSCEIWHFFTRARHDK